eukprot:968513-Lingulodinium_polyedra.AAC.1
MSRSSMTRAIAPCRARRSVSSRRAFFCRPPSPADAEGTDLPDEDAAPLQASSSLTPRRRR